MIYGIAAIANSHVFVANAHYVIGDLRAWGWVTPIMVLQWPRRPALAGNPDGALDRVAVGLNAIDMMFFIPAYPFCALHHRGGLSHCRALRLWQPPEPGPL